MDGGVDDCVDGWLGEREAGSVAGCVSGDDSVDGWMGECVNVWVDGCVIVDDCGWLNDRVVVWMADSVEGWMAG